MKITRMLIVLLVLLVPVALIITFVNLSGLAFSSTSLIILISFVVVTSGYWAAKQF